MFVQAPAAAADGAYSEIAYVYDIDTNYVPVANTEIAPSEPRGLHLKAVAGTLIWSLIEKGAALRLNHDLVAPNSTAGSIRNVNPTGSGTNCVNCVVATDATLTGRPASALPSGPQPISALQDVFGGTFKPVPGKPRSLRL